MLNEVELCACCGDPATADEQLINCHIDDEDKHICKDCYTNSKVCAISGNRFSADSEVIVETEDGQFVMDCFITECNCCGSHFLELDNGTCNNCRVD